jgi:Mg2+ and Co2+ transporter CorA
MQEDYQLHPMIITETAASVLNVKDEFINLGEYFLLNLTELPLDADAQHMNAIKIIYFSNFCIIIHYSPLFSISSVMCDELYFRALGLKHTNLLKMHRPYTKLQGTGCTEIEEILFKFIEAVLARFETYILKLYSEAKLAIVYSSELKFHSREEFIDRISMINTSLVSLGDAINQKLTVLSHLKAAPHLSESIKISMMNLNSRAIMLHEKVDSIKELAVSSLRLYEAVLFDTSLSLKERSENLQVKILIVLVLFLPLYLLPLFWGMNLDVPGRNLDNESMWGIVVGCSFSLLIAGMTVLKYSKVF